VIGSTSEAALIVIVVAALLVAAALIWGWRETGQQAALGLAFSFVAAAPFAAALGALSADGAYGRASLGLLGAGVIAAVASALADEEADAPDEVFPPGMLR
jgi:hypothetical protein